MRWWWRVHKACPNLSYAEALDIVLLAESKDLSHEYVQELDITMTLIEASTRPGPSRLMELMPKTDIGSILLRAREVRQ